MHDDQLRLIFTCCHPAIRVEHQVALTLRLIAGLTPAEVASAFLVSEDTMAKRLVRAKYKIKAAHIPYRVPDEDELPDRLRAVLSVLYLIYNAGADDVGRRDLRAEAIRLTRVLVSLMPDEPEAVGLLALLILSDARMPARGDGAHVVLLKDQDRSLWDPALISDGQALVLACMRRRRLGPFQLQAAIQALHCAARRYEDTDWAAIVRFYDRLIAVMPTPVVALNRAIAVAETEGPGDRPSAARRCRRGAGRLPPAPCRPRIDARKAGATARGSGCLRPRSHFGAYRHRHLLPEPAERRAHRRHTGKADRLGRQAPDGSGLDPMRRHAIGEHRRGQPWSGAAGTGKRSRALALRRRRSVGSSRTWTPTSSSWPARPPWPRASGLRPVTASRRRCRWRSRRTRSTGWRWRCGGSTIRVPRSSCGPGRSRGCVTTAATPRRRPSRSGWHVSIGACIGVGRWPTDGSLGRDRCWGACLRRAACGGGWSWRSRRWGSRTHAPLTPPTRR